MDQLTTVGEVRSRHAPHSTSNALEQLGQTQQQLLRHLQSARDGLSIDALSSALDISRNAVRQHPSALLAQRLVAHGAVIPTGGRPEQRYVLTDVGPEFFPRAVASPLTINSMCDPLQCRLQQTHDAFRCDLLVF